MNPLEGGRLLLVAGPCVIESREHALRTAERLKAIVAKRPLNFVFKASYDKANRTSVENYRGPGLEKGLAILAEVRRDLGLPVLSDVHDVSQVAPAAEVLDILQVPAFLCRQTDLLVAAGRTGKPVMVKKGQFMAPEDFEHTIAKVKTAQSGAPVLACERGTTFGYNNLVVDMRSLVILRRFAPVVFDGTHSVQRPAGLGGRSGGDRTMIPHLVRAAAAVGIDGLFLETHPCPDEALCDGPNQLPLDDLPALLDSVERIRAAV